MNTAVQAMIGPETLALAAAGLTVEAVSFEKTRSLEIYLPLLRASYDFAHGNPNPPLPNALERLARVEARIETLAAPEILDPEAQAGCNGGIAQQHHADGLAQDQTRGDSNAVRAGQAVRPIRADDDRGIGQREHRQDDERDRFVQEVLEPV